MPLGKHHRILQCPNCKLIYDVRKLPGQTEKWITACTFCGDCVEGTQTQLVPYTGKLEPEFSTFKMTDAEHQESLRKSVAEGQISLDKARQHGLRDDERARDPL